MQEVEILLVEDNPNDIELVLRVLQKHELADKIFTVRDGAEAIDFLFGSGEYHQRDINQKPKVILLDLKLPKIDGIEVLQKIKSDSLTKPIPVVIFTSSQEEKDIFESYKLGVNSYIVKPIDFNKFMECIYEVVFYWLLLNKSLND